MLEAVCISQSEGKLEMAAADGFRLIKVDIWPENGRVENDFRIVVPRKCCQLVSKFMAGDVEMSFDDKIVMFQTDKLKIVSQLVDGRFPEYISLFPKASPAWTATMSAPLLRNRLLQFEAQSGIVKFIGEDKSLPLTEVPLFVKLSMSGAIEEQSCYEALVPAEMTGTGKIAVNSWFMLPPCSIFSELTMEVTTPSMPVKIHGDLEGVMVVIMPMFVQWDE